MQGRSIRRSGQPTRPSEPPQSFLPFVVLLSGKPTILAIDLSGAILSGSSFVVEHHDDRVVIAIRETSDHAKMQFPFQH
jgi:hypothetical protein